MTHAIFNALKIAQVWHRIFFFLNQKRIATSGLVLGIKAIPDHENLARFTKTDFLRLGFLFAPEVAVGLAFLIDFPSNTYIHQ